MYAGERSERNFLAWGKGERRARDGREAFPHGITRESDRRTEGRRWNPAISEVKRLDHGRDNDGKGMECEVFRSSDSDSRSRDAATREAQHYSQ